MKNRNTNYISKKRRRQLLKNKRLFSILASIAVITVMTIGMVPIQAEAALPPPYAPPVPAPVVYDIYATDGFWTMADGTQIYSYGFVGGREGTKISYLDTEVQGTQALKTLASPLAAPIGGPQLSTIEQELQGKAQFPAPMITCAVGDTVILKLKNLGTRTNPVPNPPGSTLPPNTNIPPNDPHTIHLHGLDVDAANDGVPETSLAAIPANLLDSSNQIFPGAGNVIYYMFTAKLPGTYFYHCHQEADIHVNMGMYGALIVYNKGEAGAKDVLSGGGPGSPGKLFGARYDKDYVLLLSDTDVRQHLSEAGLPSIDTGNSTINLSDPNILQSDGAFNPAHYSPQFWFINGLSFPETIGGSGDNFNYGNWLQSHKGYDALVSGKVNVTGADGRRGQKVLVRMINMGFETQPMHMHGFHATVLGSDQRAWPWASLTSFIPGTGMEKNTISIGSGEEYDLLFDFGDVAVTSTYAAGTQSRYLNVTPSPSPVGPTPTSNPVIKDPSGSDYIGGPTVKGAQGFYNVGSQIFVFHNHDDYKATNDGAYPGGMFTILLPQ
jgi:manganese oxidase